MPRSPAKSAHIDGGQSPDTSLDPPRDAEDARSWRNGAGRPAKGLAATRAGRTGVCRTIRLSDFARDDGERRVSYLRPPYAAECNRG